MVKDYTSQLNAVACTGLLPEALVFPEMEVATKSALILQFMDTATF
jgi:hypothetical protein